MTPEEFHAMQLRLDEIRLSGIEIYARVPGRRAELGAKGSAIAAEFKRALDTKWDAERRLKSLAEQWRDLYGGDIPRWISTMFVPSVNVDPNDKTIRTAEIDAHPY